MRLRYARRRETLIAALAHELASWRPRPSAGGLHVAVELPDGTAEPALLAAGARHGLGLEGLSLHSYRGDAPPGLVLGCGALADAAVGHAVQVLASVVAQVAAS
jgi:GntR family transcriptional regulator/MocR family aminotransferase